MTTLDPVQVTDGWSIADSKSLYLIDRWGEGHFSVNCDGLLTVSSIPGREPEVSAIEVLEAAKKSGLKPPILIRFQDILRHRVETLNQAFSHAIEDLAYRGTYRSVYPIKVNQLREVVEEILDAGQPYRAGLETGSKAEVYAALATLEEEDGIIICNGYKDVSYIRTALIGQKLGKEVILVIEKLSEVPAIIAVAKEMSIEPTVGVRVRLSTHGSGNWATSGGEQSKFGLSTAEILEAANLLKTAGLASSLQMVHFHIGSQIPDIMTIKSAVREAARFYAKLHKLGYRTRYLDVGGGLAIDYSGTRSHSHSSMNYTLDEYARDVVYNIMDVCDAEGVPHPSILSESGRALVAHHSVLVVEVLGSVRGKRDHILEELPNTEHKLVTDLIEIYRTLDEESLMESWHDVIQIKQEAQKMFDVGLLDLPARASIEILRWGIAQRISNELLAQPDDEVLLELTDLDQELATQHICNFSVFQSLLDHWALGQLFPVVPLHHLDRCPENRATLVDITCDSDGKISEFIDVNGTLPAVPIHEWSEAPYYLGVFLTGAYQDIMGDIHNLFGRVSEVHVFMDEEEEKGFYIEERIDGSSIGDVLALTQYETPALVRLLKKQVDRAVKQGRLRHKEATQLLTEYRRGLAESTYLEV
jgi:arginine decarboxylase